MKKLNSILISNQKGFTLLEILIAIVLLAFVTMGVVNITENAMQTKERTTEVNKNNLQIETAMSRLEWDISQIYSPMYFSTPMVMNQNVNNVGNVDAGANGGDAADAGGSGQPTFNPYLQQYYEQLAQRFERNEHFLTVSKEGIPIPRFYAPEKYVFEFFTSSNRRKMENTKQSHFGWVRYTLADQEALADPEDESPTIPKSLKSLVRYFSADDPYSDKRINLDDTEKIKGAVLLRNVEKLEFQFWDYDRKKWEETLRAIKGGESIVRGVRVIITWYDSQGNKRSQTRTFRTHWPMVAPVDQPATTATAGGVNANVNANANGGANADAEGGGDD